MMPGDCFTIEPSLVQGSDSRGDTWDDGWTMTTLVSLLELPLPLLLSLRRFCIESSSLDCPVTDPVTQLIRTQSGARSAQFEHQILITEDGVEVLTR